MSDKSYWRYHIVKKEGVYGLHEFYYGGGKLQGWSSEPEQVLAYEQEVANDVEVRQNLKETLQMMLDDLETAEIYDADKIVVEDDIWSVEIEDILAAEKTNVD